MEKALRPDSESFSIFGLAPQFQLDEASLQERYDAQLMKAHPDNHMLSPGWVQQAAVRRTAQLNEAYQRLKDPVYRAKLVLRLLGGILVDTRPVPNSLLQAQLAWYERIELCQSGLENSALQKALLCSELLGELKLQWEALETALSAQAWSKAVLSLQCIQGLKRIQAHLASEG